MRRGAGMLRGAAVLCAVLVMGCPATGTGDGVGGDGGGGAGGAPTIPAPVVSATISFDACVGCQVSGVCVAPDRYHCGVDGAECVECPPPGECEVALCLDGQCATFIADDGVSCSSGVCTSGVCGD